MNEPRDREAAIMRALNAADKAALPGFPSGPISDTWLRAFLPALEAEGLTIVSFNEIRCPIFGEAKGTSECLICHGEIINCPVYGEGERKRRALAPSPASSPVSDSDRSGGRE